MRIRSGVFPTAVLCLLAAAAGCARNPVTGELQLALISEAQEIQMGQQAAAEVGPSMGLVDDPALQQYVREIGQTLASRSQRPNLPWSFAVVDDPIPNAFALPGGPIFVTRGLMALMSSEAQLATVLGHEIGHVTARHHVASLSRAQLAQLGLGLGGIFFPELQQLGGIAGAGLQLLFLAHGRDAERQADDLGFAYALEHGYDVREMALVFQSLQRLGEASGQSPTPSWLLTHPDPGDRIVAVQRRLTEAGITGAQQLRIGSQTYFDRIDGLVYGANPRNGFFRNELFLHPDLRFQLRFPSGWDRQNLAQAVLAVSPQQNAAIQLTLSDAPTIDSAAQRFLTQQGLEPGPSSRQTINGLQAIFSPFRARSSTEILQGIVAFVAYEGRVYQLIGYAPVNAYSSYESTIVQTLRSFAPLTDQQALSVQPNRIRVVRVPQTMTLREFNERYPSVIPIAELAILNQLAGPEAVIPGGGLMKQVVAN